MRPFDRYLDHLEESYVAFLLPIADRSVRKQAVNPKKAQRILVAHNAPLREPPSGIKIVEAWRYLLGNSEAIAV